MIIYPGIDIKDGMCVRLKQGDYRQVTVYSHDPVDVAYKWERLGARWLHIVDLDGARLGKPMNMGVISDIAVNLEIPVQVGGGIRDIQTIEIILNKGIQRVILGTSAVKNPGFVREALSIFQENIAIGIDARDGMARIEGWEQDSGIKAIDLAMRMEQYGAKTIIYTDISRDGMLQGVNMDSMASMVSAVGCDIIASGGVSTLKDIRDLQYTGVAGVVVGKALYTGDINFREALDALMEVK